MIPYDFSAIKDTIALIDKTQNKTIMSLALAALLYVIASYHPYTCKLWDKHPIAVGVFLLCCSVLSVRAVVGAHKFFNEKKRKEEEIKSKLSKLAADMNELNEEEENVVRLYLYGNKKRIIADTQKPVVHPLVTKGIISFVCHYGPFEGDYRITDEAWEYINKNKSKFLQESKSTDSIKKELNIFEKSLRAKNPF